MRCLFCKQSSDSSCSAEHVLPEAFGNKTEILAPGSVCDGCNNYFARKVEKPFLESAAVKQLRFTQGIPGKRGNLPRLPGLLLPGHGVEVFKTGPASMGIDVGHDVDVLQLLERARGTLLVPIADELPSGATVSRFLAKVALEALALRLQRSSMDVGYLTEHEGLDPLREHARRGRPREWPYNQRKIYPGDAGWRRVEGGDPYTIMHEYDILVTAKSEYFFVIATYGVEFAINMGGPEISGYHEWLVANDGKSPLHIGQNKRDVRFA